MMLYENKGDMSGFEIRDPEKGGGVIYQGPLRLVGPLPKCRPTSLLPPCTPHPSSLPPPPPPPALLEQLGCLQSNME